jgi:hypothetical protein
MLVYGDHSRRRHPRERIDALRSALSHLALIDAGLAAHGALADIFIAASELVQGLGDAAFDASGFDAPTPEQDAAMAFLMDCARTLIASWRSGYASIKPPDASALDRLEELNLPDLITIKQAEGYAFYALYPQAYAKAALTLSPARDTRVIGLRSIGAGLAAMVAAALDGPAPVTLRPFGHPYRRQVALGAALKASLLANPTARYAIVDEGPGRSGSSFGAVADWLEDHGVAPDRIVFFPSHGGDLGGEAGERHRRRWATAKKRVGDIEGLAAPTSPGALVAGWVEDLIGPPTTPVRDLSGGAWRAETLGEETLWPAADTFQERRKFLITTTSGDWLAKFVGLGNHGLRATGRARALAQAGFTPQVAGLRQGFLVTAWSSQARPIDLSTLDRPRFLAHLGRYLGFRAATFPARDDEGAAIEDLFHMVEVNLAEAFGAGAAEPLASWRALLPRLRTRGARVETDNRLHAVEWLALPDGRWLKADAIDHAHAHDLVGAQDIAWDLAGAAAEFALSPNELSGLKANVEARGARRIDPDLLAFLRLCYLAFQLGAYTMAAAAHPHWPQEQARLAAARDRYAQGLRRRLDAGPQTSVHPDGLV